MSETVKIAVIGGSGLYDIPEISDLQLLEIDSPFGKPSSAIRVGTIANKQVAFLPRHGEGHVYAPASVPYQANIYALKTLGVRYCVAVNACGSLREDYAPGHIVIPDQLFDYTIEKRARSFFTAGLVAHVGVADSFSEILRQQLAESVSAVGGTVHREGTFLIEDGPRFATKAESRIFQSWGCDIIGMTSAPEAFLAREAEIAYASMAHITDYDVWHDEPVNVDMVVKMFSKNIEIARKALIHVIEHLDEDSICPSHTALDHAIATAPNKISEDVIKKLHPIVARVLGR